MKNVSSSKLLAVFRSRKFWAALIGTVFVLLDELVPAFPLDAEQVTNIIYMLVAYIIGVAIDDGKQILRG